MIINGVKMLSLDNLVNNNFVGRPRDLCDYVKERGKKDPTFVDNLDCKVVFETCLGSDNPIFTLVKAYTLVFTPQDYVETKLIHDTMLESLENIQTKLISLKSSRSVDESIAHYEDALGNCEDKYSPHSKIYEASCLMIVLDEGNVVDVVTAHPRNYIENVLFAKVEYECSDCKKVKTVLNTEFEGYCPGEWFYRVCENKIEYFCPDCVDKNNNPQLTHLGDYSP